MPISEYVYIQLHSLELICAGSKTCLISTLATWYDYIYLRGMKTLFLLLAAFIIYSSAEQKNIVKFPFNTHFQLKQTETGEPLTIAAFATDSLHFYLYDMSDRSIAVLDSSGEFIKKITLQSIGRQTYTGDDFIVRNGEAIFLNAVDYKLEYFNLENGSLKKSLHYPHEIPGESKRRLRMIARIFLDNGRIYLGNNHAVFPFEENQVLKKTVLQVKRISSEKSILLYTAANPVMIKSGKIEWAKKKAIIHNTGYPMLGKNTGFLNNSLCVCSVDNSGITISRIDLTE